MTWYDDHRARVDEALKIARSATTDENVPGWVALALVDYVNDLIGRLERNRR